MNKLLLKLIRIAYRDNCTLGALYDSEGDMFLATLEEPNKGNQKGISCIPEGIYNVVPHNGVVKNVYRLENVPDRSGILIHIGNTTDDIEGCILVGLSHGKLGGKPAVMKSVAAMDSLRSHIRNRTSKDEFTLQITSI